ncbi:MAG TPA: Dabb family protein [Vicinamibacterales bacterium]
MISHIVLFRPRADVAPGDRRAFVVALEDVCRRVPTIRRATIGRSLPEDHGRDFPYTAVIEFDDEAGLRAYLSHPLHGPLANLFRQTCAATVIVNAETTDAGTPLAPFLLTTSGAEG